MKRVQVIVRGRVQGVGFRFFARGQARALGLRGFVRNRPDGSVEALCEGEEPEVDEWLGLLSKGPPHASVSELELCELASGEPLGTFEIR